MDELPREREKPFDLTAALADILTGARGLVALYLSYLGLARRSSDLTRAAGLVLFSWISDLLDGTLARRSQAKPPTWLGSRDLLIDASVSVGLVIYLLGNGYAHLRLVLAFLAVWLAVLSRIREPNLRVKIFQWPVWASFAWIAARQLPRLRFWLPLLAGVGALLFRKRLLRRDLPEFLDYIDRTRRPPKSAS